MYYDNPVYDPTDFDPALAAGAGDLDGELAESAEGRRARRASRQLRHSPVAFVAPAEPGRGVDSATLTTPRGQATLRLPERVATQADFERVSEHLSEAINRNTARASAASDELRAIAAAQQEQRAAIARLRKDQSAQATTSMLVSLLTHQQLQRRLGQAASAPKGSPADAGDDNTLLFLLPMLLGSQNCEGAGGGGDSMATMLLLLALGK